MELRPACRPPSVDCSSAATAARANKRRFVNLLQQLGRASCVYIQLCVCLDVSFEWDERKARANVQKQQRVDFADAVAVFEDGAAVTIPDADSTEEERWITIGTDAFGRLLVVVYTWRGTNIRLISARLATRRERIEHGR